MFTKIYQILMDQYGIHQSQYGIYQSHVFHFSISAVFCWKQRAPEIWDHHVIDTWFDLGALPKVESVLTHLGCRNCMCWGPNSYHFHRIWDKLINPIVWVNIPILRIPYHKCRWPSSIKNELIDPGRYGHLPIEFTWPSEGGRIRLDAGNGKFSRNQTPERIGGSPRRSSSKTRILWISLHVFFYTFNICTSPPCIFLANTQLDALYTTFFSVPRHMNYPSIPLFLGAILIQSMFLWGFNLVFV